MQQTRGSLQFQRGVKNESQEVTELAILETAIFRLVVKMYDDDAVRWRHDDVLAAVAARRESTGADLGPELNALC
jgi:hypothetical protein